MNIDQIPAGDDLSHRASRHAALADTARLRIVDLLALSDRSSGELQAELGITSNLLAHHLGVLQAAGLIDRSRSEGDRRRSYVRLRTEALGNLLPKPLLTAPRVLFVCSGNAARSPLAAALWRRTSAIPSGSAGTHPAAQTSPKALEVAARHGLDLTGHAPQALGERLREGDLVVTVCDRAHEQLPGASALHWSVPNPGAAGTVEAYERAFDELAARIATLAPRVAGA